MSATVYVTHGRKYHADANCPRMRNGEDLHDFDSDDYGGGFTAGTYRSEAISTEYAAGCGKLPCLGCVPVELRAFPPLHGQTFGHEPVFADPWEDEQICARCWWITRDEDGFYVNNVAAWPCTTAVILGLVPREVTA
jgi:hypothetical protein